MKQENVWDDKSKCWRNPNGGRICTIDNETIDYVLSNCKEFLKQRDTIYLHDVRIMLEKALEGVKDGNDLCDSDREDIRAIRRMVRGM